MTRAQWIWALFGWSKGMSRARKAYVIAWYVAAWYAVSIFYDIYRVQHNDDASWLSVECMGMLINAACAPIPALGPVTTCERVVNEVCEDVFPGGTVHYWMRGTVYDDHDP